MTGRRLPWGRLVPATLRARVTLLAALAVLAVLATASVGIVLIQRTALLHALDEALDQQADATAARLEAGEDVGARDLPSDDVVVEVIAPDGTLVAASDNLEGRLPYDRLSDGAATTIALPGGEGAARLLAKDVEGTTVLVAGNLDDVSDSTTALAGALLTAVPLTAVVLAGVVWWAVGRALRPVEDIRARVDSISGARLDHRVPEPATPEEIGRLARTMNAMLGRLQESADQQRRFVADASHELRSPLARMRAEMEVDQVRPETADPAATARSVLDEIATLQQLVDDLLVLARGDAGAPEVLSRAPVDLDEIVGRLAAHARSSGTDVDAVGVRPVQVSGSAAQLERAVGNLLNNAVRHARSRVVVTLDETDDGRAVVVVADDGPGIAAEDRERVFERFTRLDDARSTGSGGAGLGLAIARDVAERHGGSLALDGDGPGARFVLSLPVARDGNRRVSRSGPG